MIVNATDGSIIRLLVDDERFDLETAHVIQFERVLDMRSGVLCRDIEHRVRATPAGATADGHDRGSALRAGDRRPPPRTPSGAFYTADDVRSSPLQAMSAASTRSWHPSRSPTAARRARERARTDGDFERYGWIA
jgi:hypothetical protein